jgi:hypothetical protein
VVAFAIQQQRALATALCVMYKNSTLEDVLFILPPPIAHNGKLQSLETNVDYLLDLFCDYIGTPTNEEGRRWYIRSHQLRRFFAISFFWQFKYGNLPALAWMLGHLTPEHTYAYIREAIGGTELTQEEARYTANAILCGPEIQALEELRQLMLTHFNTSDITLISHDELQGYIEMLLSDGTLQLRPISIVTEDGYQYDILFEISNRNE